MTQLANVPFNNLKAEFQLKKRVNKEVYIYIPLLDFHFLNICFLHYLFNCVLHPPGTTSSDVLFRRPLVLFCLECTSSSAFQPMLKVYALLMHRASSDIITSPYSNGRLYGT